jgi:hypothetical protein
MSMNTALSGSGRVDDHQLAKAFGVKGHPQGDLRGETKFVKITEDVRKFAAEQGITEEAAIERGLQQKATELTKSGAEIYAKT